jgi:beta-lactam-binding protein with PASTA domain
VINVVGSNKNVAITALGGAGLVIDAVEVPKPQGIGANQVVFQDPGENASVCRGSSITIKYTSPN